MAALTCYKQGWAVQFDSADASGCEELVAAPGAGLSLYLDGIVIGTGAAITVTIGAGETVPGTPDAALMGPISFTADRPIAWKFDRPIAVGTNTSLVVDASGAGAVCIHAEGFTC